MNLKNSKSFNILKRVAKWILLTFGVMFTLIILLAFTEQPFWWYFNLGKANSSYQFKPDALILLGGSGMPSESNLIRAYYTLELSNNYPESKIIIALPEDSTEETSATDKLRNYLILNKLDSNRIFIENKGKNTRQQALNVLKILPDISNKNVVLVTSPEHMYRSIASFKKLNFKHLGGEPCFENAIESNILYDDNDLEGKKSSLKIGKNIQLRYQFWNHLKYQILVYREKTAYFYYWLRGWV